MVGEVEFKPGDLGSDCGYGVVVDLVSVTLNLNPHPLKAEGAAPRFSAGIYFRR